MPAAAVRPATLADAEVIGLVHVRSWQSAYRGKMPQDHLDGLDPAGRAELWRRIADAILWVLDTNNRARRFYALAGWEEDGSNKTDGSRGFDITEVRYRRTLARPV